MEQFGTGKIETLVLRHLSIQLQQNICSKHPGSGGKPDFSRRSFTAPTSLYELPPAIREAESPPTFKNYNKRVEYVFSCDAACHVESTLFYRISRLASSWFLKAASIAPNPEQS